MMSEFSSLLISNLILCCSFILSHPLYLSYFIFFSPYLLKLISFLSPLFITTFLLLLAFVICDNSSTQNNLIAALHNSLLETLKSQKDEEFDLEMYEIVFGSPVMVMEFKENQVEILEAIKEEENLLQVSEESTVVDDGSWNQDSSFSECEALKGNGEEEEKPTVVVVPKVEEKRMENFLKILDEFERMSSNVESKKKVERQAAGPKVVGKQKPESLLKYGSEATCYKTSTEQDFNPKNNGGVKELNPKIKVHSQRVSANVDYSEEENGRKSVLKAESSRNLGSSGSMRKEKEWKRTLACKLFEERHNVEGGEGMDSLWETYENESAKPKSKNDKTKKKNKKKSDIEILEEYGHEHDEDEEIEGGLCCLQALKLSAGKMNMGVGRPNLVKISKAIKGIGWLSGHVMRHSKKVHNSGDRY